jgi:hypothetical protein
MTRRVNSIATPGVEGLIMKQGHKCGLWIGITELEMSTATWRIMYLKRGEKEQNYRWNLVQVLTMTDM